jgi:hypothetical protein
VKTAKEGRVLYEGDVNIAYIDFNAGLSGITLPSGLSLSPAFDADCFAYSITDVPASFTVLAQAANSAARVIINGQGNTGFFNQTVLPPAGVSTVTIRVELPHGAASWEYALNITRTFSGIVISSEPAKKVYAIQTAANTGFNPAGMVISAVTISGAPSVVAEGQYTLAYDFTTPGTKTVLVSYNGSTAAFSCWVVGLTSLTVSGPGGHPASPAFNPSSAAYDLGTVPYTTEWIDVTAVSGIADVENASLSVTRTAPSSAGGSAVSGTPKRIALELGSNTITIVAGLNKGSGNNETRTCTITVSRVTLAVDTFYVSETGSDTTGDGGAASPYATVKKALDVVATSGLTPSDTFSIIISGTITADTGAANGMIDISGGVYPEITLRGKGTGTDAGVINAAGSNRVLYIAGGSKVTLGDNLTLKGGYAYEGGGGVYVTGSNSTFTMSGGTIQDNSSSSGGGVYVYSGGAFTMSGNAIIQGNTSSSGGGVYVSGSSSSFTMSGGTIQNNSVSASTYVYASSSGGGVYVYNSTFTISGGTIADNSVSASATTTSASASGGGVYVASGAFTMSGGTIADNSVSASATSSAFAYGGGVYVNSGTFTMSGNASIQGNIASRGGGVYVTNTTNSTFTKKGNAVIYGDLDATHTPDTPENTATSGNLYGHAVYLYNGKRCSADALLDLYAQYSGGAWIYNDTSSGGVGDTTANWQ